MAKGKAKGKKGARRPAGRRRPVARRTNVPDYAGLSAKRTITTGGVQFSSNTLYNLMNVQLADYPRAVQVAKAYQHYRIRKISVTFKPTLDTFSSGGATSKARLYYMIDKSGSIPTNISLEGLKAMGARPRDLDEKNVTIAWSPSVLEGVMFQPGVATTAPSKYKVSPWLSTSSVPVQPGVFVPSGIDHLGLYWYLDMMIDTVGYQYAIEVEVQFEFKKPLTDILSSVAAKPAEYPLLNDSPDGIVGGTDDHLATA
ncbi:hypothetical protein [Candidatus Magnetobacterium casense]|uniref:Capsid protein n=1 Tax=Candidatus Magnetobacterium casense TaxID=1455061 RepID=A0ABS6S393_9BACT|nr:hypothetical protein [Candidatus Magnetobacterium casensis]MBV6343310.1 hypothetical protein [Candidatus Magnetobacterium casensis]